MSKKNNGENVRQVSIISMNESVNLLSSYENEDMTYLTDLAVELLNKIKNGVNKK